MPRGRRWLFRTNELVSINLLEFVIEIINYAAISVLFAQQPSLCQHEYPLLLNWTDNTTAKSWIRKAATRTQKGKALQRILCSLMINNPIGIEAKHIAGINNNLADAISRVYTSSYSKLSFTKVFQEFPQMRSWNRSHPLNNCFVTSAQHYQWDKITDYVHQSIWDTLFKATTLYEIST